MKNKFLLRMMVLVLFGAMNFGHLYAQRNGGALPNAEVKNLGAINVNVDSYYKYDLIGGSGLTTATNPFDLQIAMEFIAKDSAEEAESNAYANYTTDFFITLAGFNGQTLTADGCYLAGYYPSFNEWVVIPLDGFTIEKGVTYPVITAAGFDFKYTDICTSVGDFICGIYIPESIQNANPGLTVELQLGLSENIDKALASEFTEVDGYNYDVDNLAGDVVTTYVDATTIQNAINNATDGQTITFNDDITANLTVTQKANTKITIDGNGKKLNGHIIVDGKSATLLSAGLTIKNVDFNANGISADACINLGDGSNNTRYTCNVTVDNCTFTGSAQAKVAVKSYTGGDKNLAVTNCKVDNTMHSLLQAKGIENITISNTEVKSKNGININNSTGNIVVSECDIDVKGYALRTGENGSASVSPVISITDCTLESAEEMAIEIRSNAAEGIELTMTDNIVIVPEGQNHITGTVAGSTVNADANYWGEGLTAPKVNGAPVEVESYYTELNSDGSINKDSLEDGAVAMIGTTRYSTLSEAISAVQNGETIVMIADVELANTVTIPAGKTVTLDLNGKTVSQEKECTGSYSMFDNNGKLTIKGEGIIKFKDLSNGGGSEWGSYIINNKGELIVENGTLEHLGTADNNFDTNIPIQNYAGKVTINGGTIKSTQFRSLRDFTAGGEIVINGGKFIGQVWMQGLGSGSSSLTIKGGEFEPQANDGSSVYITNGTNVVNVSITGGKFATKIGAANVNKEGVKGCITGGTFTQAAVNGTNAALLAEGFEFVENADGTYGVVEQSLAGTGTETDPYLISSLEDLVFFRDQVNSGENYYAGKYIKLAADIDMTGVNWVGIGSATADHGFMGNFDGNNFKIKNLTITSPALDSDGYAYAGLFAVTEGTDKDHQNTIKNLTIENVTITTTGHIVSAAIAYPYYTNVSNVTVCGNIKIEGGHYTSGVLAYTRRCVDASNLKVEGTEGSYIKGQMTVGGVISDIQMNGGLTANYSNFSVSNLNVSLEVGGVRNVGGIAGIISGQTLNGATVKNVKLSCDNNCVGIVAGSLDLASTITNVEFENVEGATAIIGASFGTGKPVQARIGDTYYTTIAKAMEKASETDVISLVNNFELAETLTIPAGQTVTLDLNGKTITGTPTEATAYQVIQNLGTLTITDNTEAKAGAVVCNHTISGSTSYAVNTIVNSGSLTIEAGTIENKSTASNQIGYAIDNNSTSYNSVLTIKGGKLTVSGSYYYDGIRQFCNNMTAENSVIIEGGEVSSLWMQNPSDGTQQNTKDVKGSFEITGGKLNALYLEPSTAFTGSISGGHVVSISRFQTAEGRDIENFITGGTFSQDVTEYCAEGFVCVANGDGTYGVVEQSLAGEGTETDPYLISSLEDLVFFRDQVNSGENYYAGKYIKLAADIDMTGVNWVGIGSATADHGFMGNFDGNGYTIKNLTINNPTPQDNEGYVYAGFFGVTEGTDKDHQNTIKNLTIENVTITTTGHIVSAAIAYPYYTIVDNVKVCGDIAITGGDYTAGVLAYTRRCVNASNLSIVGNTNSFVKGNITVGGVISDIQMNGGLTAEYSNFNASGVTVTGEKSVGGISGIICKQTLNGALVNNVTLTSSDVRVGIVSGSWGDVSTISNVTFADVTGATAIIGASWKTGDPVQARIENTYYATLEGALAAEGNEVTLLVPYVVEAGKVVTLDLNGKVVSYTSNVPGEDMITVKGGTLIINDSKTGGKLTYANTDQTASNVTVSTISVEPSSTITVNGGIIENKTVKADGSAIYPYAIDILTNGNLGDITVTIDGGTVYSDYMAIRQFNNGTACKNTLVVNDGYIYGAKRAIQIHMDNNAAYTTISGGKIEAGDGGYSLCFFPKTSENISVEGGEFIGTVYSGSTTGFITGGTFSENVSYYCAEGFVCVANGDGTYGVVADPSYGKVAQIGDEYYATLAEAIAAAQNGQTITMIADVELASKVTIAGKTITLDLNGKTISGVCNASQSTLVYVENNANLTIKDSSESATGKLTYAQGSSNVGWTIDLKGKLTLESGTIELTGSWSIGYAVDARPNSWGTEYQNATEFVMKDGKIVSSDGAVRVASSSADGHKKVASSFVMNGGIIDAAWDGVFIQQSDAAYDVLSFTINGGTINSDLNPVRVYGPAPTSYVNGEKCMNITFNGGEMNYTGTEAQTWVIDGILRVGGGSTLETILASGSITATEAFANANELPEGYIWSKNENGTYSVVKATGVAVIGGSQYATLSDAISAAQNGQTITMIADAELTETLTIPAGKEVVLDLNGKTISYTSTTQNEAMITNKGTLTINDGVSRCEEENGEINYNYIGAADPSYGKGNYTISNAGTLTVNGGYITIAKLSGHAKYPIDNNSTTGNAILVINGGHLYNYNTSAIRQFCNSTQYENSVTINGGKIEGYCAIWVQNPGKNTVNGQLTITGGEIKSTAKAYVDGTSALDQVSSAIYFTIAGEGGSWDENSSIAITGGTINENVYLDEEAPASVTLMKEATFNGYVSFKLSEGGQLFHNGLTDVTLMKDIEGAAKDGWYTIAMPFSNITEHNLATGSYELYRYDEATTYWMNHKATDGQFGDITLGRGYIYANTADTELEFTGDLNAAAKEITLSYTSTQGSFAGFNLIGNPFTHDITLANFSNQEALASGFYVLNQDGGFTSNTASATISACQGALVKVASETTLTINPKATREAKSNNGQLAINVSNEKYSDIAYVSFNEGLGLDKINHRNNEIPMVYVPVEGVNYAIAMMSQDVTEIPVSFKAATMGTYTIGVEAQDCEFSTMTLVDRLTGVETNLLMEDYTFMATTNDNAARFIIRLSENANTNSSDSFVFINNDELVFNNVDGNAIVKIYDMLGRPVAEYNVYESARISTSAFQGGAYIIQMLDENNVKVQKIIID